MWNDTCWLTPMASNGIAGIVGRTGFAGSLRRDFERVLVHATAKLIIVTRRPIYVSAVELRAATDRWSARAAAAALI